MCPASAPNGLLRPPRLEPGDCVGIAAPASPPPDPKAVDRALEQVERLGFKPHLSRHVRVRQGFLAGTDRRTLHDPHAELQTLYSEHIALADGFLFPVAAQLLSDDKLRDIGREMAARRY